MVKALLMCAVVAVACWLRKVSRINWDIPFEKEPPTWQQATIW